MSRELKDIIDSIDDNEQQHSRLTAEVKYLKEEIARLNFTIKEQKELINEQKVRLEKQSGKDVLEDIQILKEMMPSD